MKENYPDVKHGNRPGNQKILLALLPFWTPLIPPLGISCLKSFLEPFGYQVKTEDLNTVKDFKDVYDAYFHCLSEDLPEDKKGNVFNTGHNILQNHMMASLNFQDKETYDQVVRRIIRENYYVDMEEVRIRRLNFLISDFYEKLEEYLLDWLETENPAVLGLSIYRHTLPASLFACQLAKSKFPQIMTVMGGAVFSQELDIGSPNFQFFLEKTTYIDKIIIGEGEKLFLKLLRHELPSSQRVYTLKDIEGENLDLQLAKNPNFSDFDLSFYPYLASYSSRSCPFQCSFCAETVYWGKYRKKPAEQIVVELTQLYQAHGSQLFLMCDSLINPVVSDLANEILESRHALYWDGYLRADKIISIENTVQWRKGGFYRARLGVESGSSQVLDSMGKKITPEIIASSISNLAQAGIKTTTYWIVGYPGETEENFQETLDLIERLKDDIYEAECNPFQYFLSGQVESSQLAKKYPPLSLYPEETRDLLILQQWILDSYPSREETFRRVNRFVRHCNHLGIPNPYSLQEIHNADRRWQELHKNAVPPIIQFVSRTGYIDECKKVKKMIYAQMTPQQDIDFYF